MMTMMMIVVVVFYLGNTESVRVGGFHRIISFGSLCMLEFHGSFLAL